MKGMFFEYFVYQYYVQFVRTLGQNFFCKLIAFLRKFPADSKFPNSNLPAYLFAVVNFMNTYTFVRNNIVIQYNNSVRMHELTRWHWSLILHKALLSRSCYSVLLQLILKHTMRRFRFSSRRLAGSHQRRKSDNVDIGTSLPGYVYLTDTVLIKNPSFFN